MTTRLRAAEPTLHWSDATHDEACGQLIRDALLAAPYRHHLTRALPRIADGAPMAIPRAHHRIIACSGVELAGAVQFDPASGYLDYLFVAPPFQRRRLGSRLLQEVSHHTASPLHLTVLAVNEPGRRFYERLGFVIRHSELEHDWYGQSVEWILMHRQPCATKYNRAAS